MRPASLVLLAGSAAWMIAVDAQESTEGIPAELLCEQCPWDAPVRIRRGDFTPSNATTVVTADDMRNLGVISAADMINQLPPETGARSDEVSGSEIGAPFNLGASIEALRLLRNESTDQAESNDQPAEAPTDNNPTSNEGHASE
jgi:hypothetical protein